MGKQNDEPIVDVVSPKHCEHDNAPSAEKKPAEHGVIDVAPVATPPEAK
jgi:hypothetical protein